MKIRKGTLAFILLAALIYTGMVIVLALPLLGHRGMPEGLRVEAASSSRGKVGQPLHLTVEGTGFDKETRFMLVLDSGNQQAIISSTETLGATDTILRDGHTLYLGSRNGEVHRYDISQPEQPKFQSSYSMQGKPTALALANGTLWAASGLGEIRTWKTPAYRSAAMITDLTADTEGILYATTGKQGLIILRPQAGDKPPRQIGSLDLPGAALAIVVADRLAYVLCSNVGLHICDISDPENPRLISTLPLSGSNQSIAVKENLAFLGSNNQFVVVDLQDLRKPRVLGQLPTSRIQDIDIDNNLALLATGGSGLLAVDITDPANPFISGHLSPGDTIRCLSVDGDRAYLGTGNAGLLVVDLKRLSQHPDWRPGFMVSPKSVIPIAMALQLYGAKLPAEVIEKATSQLPHDFNVTDAAEIGPTTYLASECGLIIIDRNEPAHMEVLQQPLAATTEIVLAGTTAYISGGKRSVPYGKETGPGLQIFDVSDPVHPRARGFVETDDKILKILTQGNRAYLAVKGQGVQIVDVRDPDHPEVMGMAELPWPEQAFAGYLDIYLNDDMLYIANGRAGLHVFDVSDPRQPQRVAAINTPGGWVDRLAGDGKQLFSDNFNTKLQRYDISRPEFPRQTGTLDRFLFTSNIDISENTLRIEFSNGFGIARALPLPAENVALHGSTRADLSFAAPVFPGEYMLYAFNQQGRQQMPGIIRIEADQK